MWASRWLSESTVYSASSERQQPRRAQQNQLQCQRPLWRQRTRQLEQAKHQQHQCCSVQLHTIQQRFLFRIRPCLVSFMFLNRFKRVFQRFPNSACTMGPQFISNVYIQGGRFLCPHLFMLCICCVYVMLMLLSAVSCMLHLRKHVFLGCCELR